MNVTKRLDRMKQWAGERMGGEVKTEQTDQFKALEMEMQLRHEGMVDVALPCRTARLTGRFRHGQDATKHDDLCEIPNQS